MLILYMYNPDHPDNLTVGAVPPQQVDSVVKGLVQALNDFSPYSDPGPHISSGAHGARWVLQVLVAHNQSELALDLASQTSAPSWGNMSLSVPGTFSEDWVEGESGSHNHVMFSGGIDPYLYQHVCGLRTPSAALNALGFGRGIGRVPSFHVDLGK